MNNITIGIILIVVIIVIYKTTTLIFKSTQRNKLVIQAHANWEKHRLIIRELSKPFGHDINMNTSHSRTDEIIEENYKHLKAILKVSPSKGFKSIKDLEKHFEKYNYHRKMERKYYKEWCYYAGTNKNYRGKAKVS